MKYVVVSVEVMTLVFLLLQIMEECVLKYKKKTKCHIYKSPFPSNKGEEELRKKNCDNPAGVSNKRGKEERKKRLIEDRT